MKKTEHCELCGVELEAGDYGTKMNGRSSHHRIPERFNKFSTQGNSLPEDKDHELLILCYFCHEELLHNPILLLGVEEELRKAFAGKDYIQRLAAFAEIIQLGAEEYDRREQRTGGP